MAILSRTTAMVRATHALGGASWTKSRFYDHMTALHPVPVQPPGKRGPKADPYKVADRRFRQLWRLRVTLPAQNSAAAFMTDPRYLRALWEVFSARRVRPDQRVATLKKRLLDLRVPEPAESTMRGHFLMLAKRTRGNNPYMD